MRPPPLLQATSVSLAADRASPQAEASGSGSRRPGSQDPGEPALCEGGVQVGTQVGRWARFTFFQSCVYPTCSRVHNRRGKVTQIKTRATSSPPGDAPLWVPI